MKILYAALALLAGCATQVPDSPEVVASANEPLYCKGADQCSLYWKRAQLWVVQNSRWKIQTANDVQIVTFNPIRASVERGYQITREPQADGRERIVIASACANMIRCETTEAQSASRFKTYVRGN